MPALYPDPVRLRDGQAFQAENFGGEIHTFTEVDEFGGGFIPDLNVFIAGDQAPTPECLAIAPEAFTGEDFSFRRRKYPGQVEDPASTTICAASPVDAYGRRRAVSGDNAGTDRPRDGLGSAAVNVV